MSDFHLHSSGLDYAKWFQWLHSRPLKPFGCQVDCLYAQCLGSSAAPHYGESILPFIHPNLLSHMPHRVPSIGSCLLNPFWIVWGLKCIKVFSPFRWLCCAAHFPLMPDFTEDQVSGAEVGPSSIHAGLSEWTPLRGQSQFEHLLLQHVGVGVNCQPDESRNIWEKDLFIGRTVGDYLDYYNWCGKTHINGGWNHSLVRDPGLYTMENAVWELACI